MNERKWEEFMSFAKKNPGSIVESMLDKKIVNPAESILDPYTPARTGGSKKSRPSSCINGSNKYSA
jgi:hypothetical protein